MTQYTLRFAAGSDVGRRRRQNEDSGLAGPWLLAVADGMGGHPHGDVASRTALSTLAALDDRAGTARLTAAVAEVSARLAELGRRDPQFQHMGTTLTALAWDGTGFTIAHVGDSRAYLLRGGRLHQLTRDHTLVQALVDQGKLTPEQAVDHPNGSLLIRALKSGSQADPDLFRCDAERGDRYLVCSDGITAALNHDAVTEALHRAATPDDAVRLLIDLANRAGGPDNITCIVADVMPLSSTPKSPRIAVGALANS